MYEELYIIDNGNRLRVDLNVPSGITLNFKSNIFGDLSKITASYSYTFKLPMTTNNRRVLDMAEDIRHTSGMIRKRLKCEFVQNGIPLFDNANLYIDGVENAYNAVMTWGVVEGFDALKDNDCSLTELEHTETIVTFGATDYERIQGLTNAVPVLQPEYSCGLPYRIMERTIYEGYRNGTYYHTYKYDDERFPQLVGYGSPAPYPVVPIRHLIDTINSQFGVNFDLSESLDYADIVNGYDKSQRLDVLKRGVIPCTERNQKYSQLVDRSLSLSSLSFTNDNVYGNTLDKVIYAQEGGDDIKSVVSFGVVSSSSSCPFEVHSSTPRYGISPKMNDLGAKCFGRLLVKFKEFHQREGGRQPGAGASRGDSSSSSDGPTLAIVQRRNFRVGRGGASGTPRIQYKIVEIASFEGENVGADSDGYYVYEFDFREFEGLESLEMSNLTTGDIFFTFNEAVYSIQSSGRIDMIPDYENVLVGQPMDVFLSLPDLSCMTLIKSLFYMIGAYPTSTKDGRIIPVFYDELKTNMARALDWSDKQTTDASALPAKIVFKVGDVAQRNYYLMKSDNLDNDEDEIRENVDIYASGVGILVCGNELLNKDKTVINLPFSAPYIQNRKTPRYDTGHTFKAWEYIAKEFKACTPNPIVGLIDTDIVTTYTKDIRSGSILKTTKETRWTMTCWNGFAEMSRNPSFAYMQKIFANPYVITEKLNLNEHDLRHLDYTVPVYLEKYGAYFAIVSISRDSKGISKCELLKLPEEE